MKEEERSQEEQAFTPWKEKKKEQSENRSEIEI
jgi:hypothetical protein